MAVLRSDSGCSVRFMRVELQWGPDVTHIPAVQLGGALMTKFVRVDMSL